MFHKISSFELLIAMHDIIIENHLYVECTVFDTGAYSMKIEIAKWKTNDFN